MDAARRIADQIKRNGEFDKCRKEVLAKVLESESMKRSTQQCHRLVKDVLRNTRPNTNIATLREMVKDEIRRRNLISPLLNRAERAFHDYESSSKLHEMIEEMTRSELGLPPLDTNIELVDMDVSSGTSSASTTSDTPSASTGRSTPGRKVVNGYVAIKREVSESPPPPPLPPARDSVSSPPPPPSLKRPYTPPFTERHSFRRNHDRDKEQKYRRKSSPSDSDESVRHAAVKTEATEPSPLSTSNSSPRYEYVSRSPSVISDDSLPPLPNVPTTLTTSNVVDRRDESRPTRPPPLVQHAIINAGKMHSDRRISVWPLSIKLFKDWRCPGSKRFPSPKSLSKKRQTYRSQKIDVDDLSQTDRNTLNQNA